MEVEELKEETIKLHNRVVELALENTNLGLTNQELIQKFLNHEADLKTLYSATSKLYDRMIQVSQQVEACTVPVADVIVNT
jgi:phage shock protein A